MSRKREPIFGLGVNDLDYNMWSVNGTLCKAGQMWRDIIKRVASEKFQNKRPEYKGCTISNEWIYASNFVNWVKSQDYKNKSIDKDIIVIGNKHYSKETCCLVTNEVNSLMCISSRNNKNNLLLGVTYRNKYISQISFKGEHYHIGNFNLECEAHNAYRLKRAEFIRILASEENDKIIIDGLIRHAERFEDLSCII